MALGADMPRRVTPVRPAQGSESAAQADPHSDYPVPSARESDGLDRLLRVLEDLTSRARRGDLVTDADSGVLLDVLVGNVRCVLLDHRPTLVIGLSPREQQVALMVANGRTNQAIATALEISVWTVSTHLRRIFAKLAVSSRAEMVAHLVADPEFSSVVDHPH